MGEIRFALKVYIYLEKFMAEKRDYYEVLGIQKGATEEEIKKAYRKKQENVTPICTPMIPPMLKNFRR